MNILVNGACGRMGKEVLRLIEEGGKHSIAARVDIAGDGENILCDITDFGGKADVIIDFSHHSCTGKLLEYAVKTGTPAVIATTGHTDEELEMIRAASEKVAVFHSANMSLGVALLADLAVKAASVMQDADIEIVETHHNRKLDSPSGTALMIANAIRKVRSAAKVKAGRSGSAKREKDEIGIHAVRYGNIVGIHEVVVSTDTQTITLKHEAHTRTLFADGALSAAEFILSMPCGLYDMNSIVKG